MAACYDMLALSGEGSLETRRLWHQVGSVRAERPLLLTSAAPRGSLSLASSPVRASASSRSEGSTAVAAPATASSALPQAPVPAVLEALKRGLQEAPRPAALTHLESNSWLLELGGARFLIDPILEGPLDFGLPALIKVSKRNLENLGVAAVVDKVDAVLLTQSLDDHCHAKTMHVLSQLRPNIPIIAPPSAKKDLQHRFSSVTYLAPGETVSANSVLERPQLEWQVTVRATAGAQVGLPWSAPENGYIVSCSPPSAAPSSPPSFSLYIEPHCMYKAEELESLRADVVVSHPFKVLLTQGVPILDGMDAAVRLARLLQCKTFVPYRNDRSIGEGLLVKALQNVEGSTEACQALLKQEMPSVDWVVPEAGEKIIFDL